MLSSVAHIITRKPCVYLVPRAVSSGEMQLQTAVLAEITTRRASIEQEQELYDTTLDSLQVQTLASAQDVDSVHKRYPTEHSLPIVRPQQSTGDKLTRTSPVMSFSSLSIAKSSEKIEPGGVRTWR